MLAVVSRSIINIFVSALDNDPNGDGDDEFGSEDFQHTSDQEWYPYPNKTYFLLDTLDNLPRLRLSNELMRMILWVLREAHARNVPSFKAFRAFQDSLRKNSGIRTHKFESPRGNIFYANDIVDIITKANICYNLPHSKLTYMTSIGL